MPSFYSRALPTMLYLTAAVLLWVVVPAPRLVAVHDAVKLPDGTRYAVSKGSANGAPITLPAGTQVYSHFEWR